MATNRGTRPRNTVETVDTSRRVDGAAARRARRSTLEPTHSRYRPTVDVDMVLHIETGATTFPDVRDKLEDLGYEIQMPAGDGPVHRFTRHNSEQQVGVMVADNLSPRFRPTVKGRPVFGIPAGTSALQKTVNCEIDVNGTTTRLSVPTVLEPSCSKERPTAKTTETETGTSTTPPFWRAPSSTPSPNVTPAHAHQPLQRTL